MGKHRRTIDPAKARRAAGGVGGDVLQFPEKPDESMDAERNALKKEIERLVHVLLALEKEYPWPVLKSLIKTRVKYFPPLPEGAPEVIAERMKPDVLRWIARTREIMPGIPSEETRDRLVTFFAEVLMDRTEAEMMFERGQQEFFEEAPV